MEWEQAKNPKFKIGESFIYREEETGAFGVGTITYLDENDESFFDLEGISHIMKIQDPEEYVKITSSIKETSDSNIRR